MSTKYSDDPITENAKKMHEEEQKVVARSQAEYAERMKGKPTPTQEELNISALGGHILEHEDDGSGPDPHNNPQHHTRHMEAAAKPASYQTRSAAGAAKATGG